MIPHPITHPIAWPTLNHFTPVVPPN